MSSEAAGSAEFSHNLCVRQGASPLSADLPPARRSGRSARHVRRPLL